MKINKKLVLQLQEYYAEKLIKYGGEFMYNFKISNEVTDQVKEIGGQNKKKEKLDELLRELTNINTKFKPNENVDLGKGITLEKMEFDPKSDKEIEDNAKTVLHDFKTGSEKQIKDENKLKGDTLNSSKQGLIEDADNKKQQLNSYYESAKQNTSDEALKRGLARSSIVISQLNAFDKDQINKFDELDKELSSKVEAINFQLEGLSAELENALNEFDVTYAVKLQEKINTLTKDLQSQEMEIKKYNNDIALKEAEYNQNLAKLQHQLNDSNYNNQLDMAEIYGKYGANVVNRVIEDDLYKSTKNYLSSLSKDEIEYLLNSDEIISALGNNVYKTLVKEFLG